MTLKLRSILIVLLMIIVCNLSAQNSQVMYFMNIPQNHLMNPALRPTNSVYVGLPGLSGINLNINNNFVNFSDVFIKGQPHDSIISFLHPDYDVDKFLAKIKDRNFFETETSVQLLGVGFSIGADGYVFLDVNERIDGNLVLPGDLFRLALKGNQEFTGKTIDLSGLRAGIKAYHEFGLGYSRNITDKLRIGFKGKLLFGIGTASLINNSLGITVNNDYSHTFDANMEVRISGPVIVYQDSKNNIDSIKFDGDKFKNGTYARQFFTGSTNLGFGLDIGATYELNDRTFLSAAITDLGFITWTNDVTVIKANNEFKFSGLNMEDYFNGSKTIDEIGRNMIDSLKNAFASTVSNKQFTTTLPFGISVAGNFSITPQISLGLLSYTRIIEKQAREALTLSANLNLGNVFSTSLSYTASNYRYDNIGAGISFRAGVTQFYLVSDRLPIYWDKIKDSKSTVVLPSSWNTINLRFGMNLVFGNRVKEKKDKPMIEVE